MVCILAFQSKREISRVGRIKEHRADLLCETALLYTYDITVIISHEIGDINLLSNGAVAFSAEQKYTNK